MNKFDNHLFLHIKVCFIHVVLQEFDKESVKVLPKDIVLSTVKELTQYFIQDWSLDFWDKGNNFKEIKE